MSLPVGRQVLRLNEKLKNIVIAKFFSRKNIMIKIAAICNERLIAGNTLN
jgi:hypothetical protein